jgi:hypothetical protein
MTTKKKAAPADSNADEGFESFRRWHADFEAGSHLKLYKLTRNGLHIWRAYLVYRQYGFSVPEAILKKIDSYASGLCRCTPPGDKTPPEKRIAEILEMRTYRGGIPAAARLSKVEQRLQKILAVRAFNTAYPQEGITKAYKVAAEQFGVSWPAIKTLYRDWVKFEAGLRPRYSADTQPTHGRARKVRLMR